MKTIHQKDILPKSIIQRLDAIEFPKGKNQEKDRAIKLIIIIFNKLRFDKLEYDSYVDLPSTYLIKCIGREYKKVVTKLKDARILEEYISVTGNTYWNNQCKRYRINPELFDLEFDLEFDLVEFKKRGYNKNLISNDDFLSQVGKDILQLDIYHEDAKKWIKEYVNSFSSDDLILNESIIESPLLVFFNHSFEYLTKEQAIIIAEERGESLIKDNDKFYIDNPENYLSNKKRRILSNYNDLIIRFLNKSSITPNRNNTNFRLDTILTSFPSNLLQFITLHNTPLVNIDLCNSQFTILSYIYKLSNTTTPPPLHRCYASKYKNKITKEVEGIIESFKKADITMIDKDEMMRFCELCNEGKLYYFIGTVIKVTRDEAKIIMIVVAFSSYKWNSDNKKQFEKLFPTIHKFINNFKKVNGNNQFAISLQKMEAFIFIDNVYMKLIEKGYTVFTKHDSILCKESEAKEIAKIVHEELNGLDFSHSLSLHGEIIVFNDGFKTI